MIQLVLLALFLVGSCSSAAVVPDNQVCTAFQAGQPMQGLTVNGSTLYAIVNFHVYSIPLSAENILSGGRFALFNITDEGLWSSLPWLDILANKTMQYLGGWGSLLQLNLIPISKESGVQKLVHAIYKKSPEEQESFTFELLPGNKTQALREDGGKTLLKRFAFFSDGSGHGYIVRNGSEGQTPEFRPDPFAVATDYSVVYPALSAIDHPSYFATISKPGYLMLNPSSSSDSSSFQEQNHLVTEPENAFGFLFKGTFHYWDLSKKQVVLFKDPLTMINRTVRFKTVPMSKYFVCSQELWSTAVPSDDDYIEDITSSGLLSLFAWLIIAGLLIVVFVSLFTFVLWRVCRKEKQTLTISNLGNPSPKSRLFLKSLSRVPSSTNNIPQSSTSLQNLAHSSTNKEQQQQTSSKSTREQTAVSTTPSTIATSAFNVEDLRNSNTLNQLEFPKVIKISQEGQTEVYRVVPACTSTLPSEAPSWTTSAVLNAPSSVDSDLKATIPQTKTPTTKSSE